MADIKQAAQWMQEGKTVSRPNTFNVPESEWAPSICMGAKGRVVDPATKVEVVLMVGSLLADDWEVAE